MTDREKTIKNLKDALVYAERAQLPGAWGNLCDAARDILAMLDQPGPDQSTPDHIGGVTFTMESDLKITDFQAACLASIVTNSLGFCSLINEAAPTKAAEWIQLVRSGALTRWWLARKLGIRMNPTELFGWKLTEYGERLLMDWRESKEGGE